LLYVCFVNRAPGSYVLLYIVDYWKSCIELLLIFSYNLLKSGHKIEQIEVAYTTVSRKQVRSSAIKNVLETLPTHLSHPSSFPLPLFSAHPQVLLAGLNNTRVQVGLDIYTYLVHTTQPDKWSRTRDSLKLFPDDQNCVWFWRSEGGVGGTERKCTPISELCSWLVTICNH